MQETVEVGIGFVTGRANVCKIINNYYKNMLKQVEKVNKKVNITVFIMYDLNYQFTKREDFYKILPDVLEAIKIQYITPEDIEEEKKKMILQYSLKKKQVDLILGYGHAKGRNTVMYYALKNKIDYLLFWDDDEYPEAVLKNVDKSLQWVKQENILKHLENMEQADVTIGHHCGYISPIPYIDIETQIEEEEFKNFIESISNDIISWDSIKSKFEEDNGVTFASKEVLKSKAYQIVFDGVGKWVAGSTLCINLDHISKIPAFYNPEGARGEDTFFSTNLKDSIVKRVPVYHFHDGFLKYTNIMQDKYPKILRKISTDENRIEARFMQASLGWIKYKPLLMYLSNKENYQRKMEEIKGKLETSIPKMDKIFENVDFYKIIEALGQADKDVEKSYEEYIQTNYVWNKIKQYLK